VSYAVVVTVNRGRVVDDDNDPEDAADDAPAALPIDGVLDLHAFAPRETAALVRDYLEACRERGILAVRIIHGKGIGLQRERVHQVLRGHPAVVSFHHPSDEGGWGATVVQLLPGEPADEGSGDGG
jgi:dsDNA-specific endonuclease/ATPase MutS2